MCLLFPLTFIQHGLVVSCRFVKKRHHVEITKSLTILCGEDHHTLFIYPSFSCVVPALDSDKKLFGSEIMSQFFPCFDCDNDWAGAGMFCICHNHPHSLIFLVPQKKLKIRWINNILYFVQFGGGCQMAKSAGHGIDFNFQVSSQVQLHITGTALEIAAFFSFSMHNSISIQSNVIS